MVYYITMLLYYYVCTYISYKGSAAIYVGDESPRKRNIVQKSRHR